MTWVHVDLVLLVGNQRGVRNLQPVCFPYDYVDIHLEIILRLNGDGMGITAETRLHGQKPHDRYFSDDDPETNAYWNSPPTLDFEALLRKSAEKMYNRQMVEQKAAEAITEENQTILRDKFLPQRNKPKSKEENEEDEGEGPFPRYCTECNKGTFGPLFDGVCGTCGLWQRFSQASLIV